MSQKKKGHAPAHQNKFTWAHNPNSKLTKKIYALEHYNLCYRCDAQIEWRKNYRKYKMLTAMRRCSVCQQHAINRAYHTICDGCAQARQVCAKCAKPYDITAKAKPIPDEEVLDAIKQSQIKERFKRTITRNWERGLFINSDILKILELLNNGETVVWEDWIQQDEEDDEEEVETKKPHVHGSSCGSGGCGHSHGPSVAHVGPNTSVMGKLEHAEKMKKAEALRKLDLSELLPEDFNGQSTTTTTAPTATTTTTTATTTATTTPVTEEKVETPVVVEAKNEEEKKEEEITPTEPVAKEKKKIVVKPKATMSRTSAMMSIAKGKK